MPHIHNEPGHHDLTISAFIVRTDGPEPAVILHYHRKSQKMLQFGGHVELDEHPWAGLIRELREESGYDIEQLQVLQPQVRYDERYDGAAQHPIPMNFNTHRFLEQKHFHTDLVYAMLASEPPRHPIGDGESTDIRQYTRAELDAIPDEDIYRLTRTTALFILDNLSSWEALPATDWPA